MGLHWSDTGQPRPQKPGTLALLIVLTLLFAWLVRWMAAEASQPLPGEPVRWSQKREAPAVVPAGPSSSSGCAAAARSAARACAAFYQHVKQPKRSDHGAAR